MWRYVKIPKAISLLAFFLPWMTVSCSNQKMADATGWQLITGKPHLTDAARAAGLPETLPASYFLATAFALIVIGLALAFRKRAAPKTLLASSLVALLATWGGSLTYSSDAIAAALRRKGGLAAITGSNIQVEWLWGFWLAIVALAIAAMLAFLAIRDPDGG